MKYQVLLVDDEQIYLQYLQEIIDWEAAGCRICGCARNGKEAVTMAQEKQPDIVFMDINMSRMDGLDACAVLKEKNSSAKVIIMTAFNEFSFAHRAIKLDVADYLLKPFDAAELMQTLKKCIGEICRERQYQKEQKESFLKSLLDSGISGREKEQMEEMISNHCYVAVLFRKKQEVSFYEREKFRIFLGSYFAEAPLETYFLGNQGGCGTIIHTMVEEQIPLKKIKQIYQKLILEHPEEGFEWIAIGNVVEGIENLPETYQNAKIVRENRVKIEGTVNSFEEVQQLSREIVMLGSGDIRLLIRAFEQKDYREVDQMIERIFALSQNRMFSFQYVIATYYSLVAGICGYYHCKEDGDLADLQETQSSLISEISLCSTTSQMLEIVRNYVYEAFCECMNVRVGSKKEILASRIEAYLQQHYAEKTLSVNQIAESLFFENSYIRRVFRVQTGKTIIQRLEEIRFEKARELLAEGRYTNGEIAELTGYSDQYYFSKRFKLFFGCSPAEYPKRDGKEK